MTGREPEAPGSKVGVRKLSADTRSVEEFADYGTELLDLLFNVFPFARVLDLVRRKVAEFAENVEVRLAIA
jgi:hypothetical protein